MCLRQNRAVPPFHLPQRLERGLTKRWKISDERSDRISTPLLLGPLHSE